MYLLSDVKNEILAISEFKKSAVFRFFRHFSTFFRLLIWFSGFWRLHFSWYAVSAVTVLILQVFIFKISFAEKEKGCRWASFLKNINGADFIHAFSLREGGAKRKSHFAAQSWKKKLRYRDFAACGRRQGLRALDRAALRHHHAIPMVQSRSRIFLQTIQKAAGCSRATGKDFCEAWRKRRERVRHRNCVVMP